MRTYRWKRRTAGCWWRSECLLNFRSTAAPAPPYQAQRSFQHSENETGWVKADTKVGQKVLKRVRVFINRYLFCFNSRNPTQHLHHAGRGYGVKTRGKKKKEQKRSRDTWIKSNDDPEMTCLNVRVSKIDRQTTGWCLSWFFFQLHPQRSTYWNTNLMLWMLSSSCTSLGKRSLELVSPLRLSDTIKTSGHLPVLTNRLQETHTASFPVWFLLRLQSCL